MLMVEDEERKSLKQSMRRTTAMAVKNSRVVSAMDKIGVGWWPDGPALSCKDRCMQVDSKTRQAQVWDAYLRYIDDINIKINHKFYHQGRTEAGH